MTGVDAVVFDLDGTLVDTEGCYRDAFHATAAAQGIAVPPELYGTLVGIATPDRRVLLRAALGPDFPEDAFFAAYYARRAAAMPGAVPAVAGAAALLASLPVPVGVATSASRATAERSLRGAGLRHLVRVLVTRDEVARGKPAPDAFRLAARLLHADPARCIAVEDSVPGAASARAAGMRVLQLGTPGLPDLRAAATQIALAVRAVPALSAGES